MERENQKVDGGTAKGAEVSPAGETEQAEREQAECEQAESEPRERRWGAPRDGEPGGARAEFVRVGRRWSASFVSLVESAVALDDSGEWALDGSPTCAHWIADMLGVEVCTSREWLRVGRALGELPRIRGRFEEGELSFTQVRALTRHAEPSNEAELLAIAARERPGHLARALVAWAARHEDDEQRHRRQQEQRSLRWSLEPDGMVQIRAFLPPQHFACVSSAIDAEVRRYRPATDGEIGATGSRGSHPEWLWPSIAQQRADSLVRLATRIAAEAGGEDGARDTGGLEAEVIFHVRGDGATADDGTPVALCAVGELLDEAALRVMIHDAEGKPINASGRHRHHTLRQRRVVKERDGSCVVCGSEELLEYHHEPPYEKSGRTLIEETLLLCANCHHSRHRGAA